ncbi:hypothetical protein EUV02_09420 [Polymorphobacter arshaanensis]|uniref:Uncharacterized protein n=1 Tax=Glacieibacterium arshaanense TaxID=2511025 RepID=A0A4Y9EMX6_9SPHN|nr:GatB/YqeY domain-containing protein [Polymorphobacter arshaanensis]TFU03387.1 hypothetical protein EUV02_09420 [Polymorphobacter arshaanensis]
MDEKANPAIFEEDAAEALKRRVRADLGVAIKQRHAAAISALRSLMAALDNAQAVPTDAQHVRYVPRDFADRSAEVARLKLTPADVARLVAHEVESRHAAAAQMAEHGRSDHAEKLLAEAAVLKVYVEADVPTL